MLALAMLLGFLWSLPAVRARLRSPADPGYPTERVILDPLAHPGVWMLDPRETLRSFVWNAGGAKAGARLKKEWAARPLGELPGWGREGTWDWTPFFETANTTKDHGPKPHALLRRPRYR